LNEKDEGPFSHAINEPVEPVASDHFLIRMVDAALTAQAPLAVSYVAKLRAGAKDLSPAHVLKQLERQLLAATTSSGAAVGGAAAAPGVGTAAALALTLGETAVSLQASVFYILAVAEVHQVRLAEVERRRTLVLAVLLGNGAEKAIHKVAERTGQHWARHTLDAIPAASLRQINKYIGRNFVTKYGTKQGIIVLGKVVPFGFGAVIGGGANFLVGRTIIEASRRAFGKPRTAFAPAEERFEDPNDYVSDDRLEPAPR
jgi:hypothetical protein